MANEGRCSYCTARADEVDHLIPFADGGADTLANLVPCCSECNKKKGTKSVPEWWCAMDLRIRWWRDGTIDGPQMTLREMYLSTHEEILQQLTRLEEIVSEVRDPDRQLWFRQCAS